MKNCHDASTTIIHRPFGLLAGYRQVTDQATRVCVHAFPPELLTRLSAAALLTTAGTYVITDHRTAYIGESNHPIRRLARHALDELKRAFARDIYVVSACDGSSFDKPLAMDLQFRLTNRALKAGRVMVAKGSNPAEPTLSPADRSTHDRIFADVMRLLGDAGCGIFDAVETVEDETPVRERPDRHDPDDDAGPMQIGVATAPMGAQEFELTYDEIWARAYEAAGHFIVAAGSEVRATINVSCDPVTRRRREDLAKAGVLSAIPGVTNRHRLAAAVAFPTASVAAKVICGAHTTPRWLTLSPSPAVVLQGSR